MTEHTPGKKGPGAAVADVAKKGAEKVAGGVVKKSGAAIGKKIAGESGGVVGGVIGTAATLVGTKATKDLPKEGAKTAAGMATGKGIDFGTKYLVTHASKTAAAATAAEAGKASVQLAACQGAAAAAGGGFASMAGELAGGFVGKQLGKKLAKRLKQGDAQAKDLGGKIGEELGAVSGAAGAGAVFGALAAGPVGAVGGAGLGIAGHALGKATGAAIEKASVFQGVSLVTPKLQIGDGGTCSQDEATRCIVTEESPGLGRCIIYFYRTDEEARDRFKKWWCSRIIFGMQEGRLVTEEERAGWPWNQANILASVRNLWAEIIPRPSELYEWTSTGVEAAEKTRVWEFLGGPVVGDVVTDEQVEAFALSGTSVEALAAQDGYFKVVTYRWTGVGIAAAADAHVLEFLENPLVGDTLTDQQLAKFRSTGTTLDKILELGYVERS